MTSLRQFDAAMQAGHHFGPKAPLIPIVEAPKVAKVKATTFYMA